MTFTALQARVNSAVSARIATDDATLNGVAVTGKFTSAYAQVFSGDVGGMKPTFSLQSHLITEADIRGVPFVYKGIRYIVRSVEPDGHGYSILELEEQ